MTNANEFEDWKQVLKRRQVELDITISQVNAEFALIAGRNPANTLTSIKQIFSADASCRIDTFLALVEALGGVVIVRWENGDDHKLTQSDPT